MTIVEKGKNKSYEELPLGQNSYCYWSKWLQVAIAERHLNSVWWLDLLPEEYWAIAMMIDYTLDQISAKKHWREMFEKTLKEHYY